MRMLTLLLLMSLFAVSSLSAQSTPPEEVIDPVKVLEYGFIVTKGTSKAQPHAEDWQKSEDALLRVAKTMALRNLMETVGNLSISSETTVRKTLLEDDRVLTKVEGSLQGAQTIYEHFDATNQRATVYVRYPVKGEGGLTQTLLPQLRTVPPAPGSTGQLFDPPASQPAKPVTGDGLIVDVTDHAFQPALVNHILTEKGDSLYDPSKIASSILVERGSGDYTNEISKAKAILAKHGRQSPLIVKA